MRLNRLALTAALAASAVFAGCTTTLPTTANTQASAAQQRQSINSAADETLNRLYQQAPDSRALIQRAHAVLVFPEVLSGAFVVGFEHGVGVLRVKGAQQGYYTTTGGSIGWQAGAQSKAMVLVFTDAAAYEKFRNSNGWTIGADATVAVANIGANGSIDTQTARQPVVGFVLNNGGLMAGVSIDGTRIARANNL
ncbi:twin-arginine translocation pathway signal [Achromobacter sp. GG226]|uniref:BPSL1445 family SYLF domain-containing lipoprotein n=1 Tax=Verticiella alkaliphila TaxID=2779529 RepID=UPI001C0C2646|nr:YSC84-related protein [Verticiella sp. GG226]MBU4610696.1 twin-arginine translocation pathway signal [Verticiella sp. GG226]